MNQDKILEEIGVEERLAKEHIVGGFFDYAARDFERAAKLYEQLGNAISARGAYKRVMICSEKMLHFDDAQRLASLLNDPIAGLYRNIEERISEQGCVSDDDRELQKLFKKIERSRKKTILKKIKAYTA